MRQGGNEDGQKQKADGHIGDPDRFQGPGLPQEGELQRDQEHQHVLDEEDRDAGVGNLELAAQALEDEHEDEHADGAAKIKQRGG